MLLSFALTGLAFFYSSLLDMEELISKVLKQKYANIISFSVVFLSAFGIYLGRFLRYNSWEILSQPSLIVSDILDIVIRPFQNYEALLFTFCFGCFLTIGFRVFKLVKKS